MKRRYVICIDDATAEQENKVTAFLKENKVGWWHWIKNIWLVYDNTDKWPTAGTLRAQITSAVPGPTFLIILLDEGNGWSGYGPPKMYEWIHKNWDSSK
jgi:hypothetical protein